MSKFSRITGAYVQFEAEKFRKDPAVVLAAVQRKPEAEAERNVAEAKFGKHQRQT